MKNKITHEGKLNLIDHEINCYVLKDGTRVLSGRGIQETLKLVDDPTSSGTRILRLLGQTSLEPFLYKDRDKNHFEPIVCYSGKKKINGYEATVLVDICDAMLDARSSGINLGLRQEIVAKQCEILIRAFAKVGITALVDEATGYQRIRDDDALQKYLNKILSEELVAWAKKFPNEFYENIYKLKKWEWHGMKKNHYSVVAYYTNNLIYERIAPGLLDELKNRSPVNNKGKRKNKLHQWLNEDAGNPMLSQHLHTIVILQRQAIVNGQSWDRFVKTIDQVMPKKGNTLELNLGDPNI